MILLELLYPSRCPVCDRVLPVGEKICKKCEEKLKKKNEIISDLKETIECLKMHLESVEEPGVARLVKNLNDNQEMLNKL